MPSRHPGKFFGYGEGLGEKSLNFSGAGDNQFIFRREFFHAQDSDDILQLFVALEDSLDGTGNLIMFIA